MNGVRRMVRCSLAALAMGGLAGCDAGNGAALVTGSPGRIRVTATVGMVAYTVQRVGGDRVAVTSLMGPGVDPHLYSPSQGDLSRLSGAQIVFYNGLNLEGKMGQILEKLGRDRPTVAVSDGVDRGLLREHPTYAGHFDPHIWFDVQLWSATIEPVVKALSEFAPPHAEEFRANGEAYRKELAALHEEVRKAIATIPKPRRVLVTAHDAFGYFGRAYDIEVVGLQGISTLSDVSVADVRRLVELISSRGIRAVFVESSVSEQSVRAVVEGCRARGHEARIGGTLFSDAMGAAGTPEGTYPGMVRANVGTIVRALKGDPGA